MCGFFTPQSLKGADEQADFAAHHADAAVVVAYGLLLPRAILDAPKFGCFTCMRRRCLGWRGRLPSIARSWRGIAKRPSWS